MTLSELVVLPCHHRGIDYPSVSSISSHGDSFTHQEKPLPRPENRCQKSWIEGVMNGPVACPYPHAAHRPQQPTTYCVSKVRIAHPPSQRYYFRETLVCRIVPLPSHLRHVSRPIPWAAIVIWARKVYLGANSTTTSLPPLFRGPPHRAVGNSSPPPSTHF